MDASSFSTRRAALIADDSLQGLAFAVAYSALADEWVRDLLGSEPGVAVIAAGALGRCELAPASDLDLVLVHDGRRDASEVAERIWYPIWDARIALDHSVRTPKDATAIADADLKVVLGLLDGRPIAGDEALAEQVLTSVRERWVSRARKRLAELQSIGDERHAKEGDVAHLLAPDLKQSKGGLRDLRVLHALEVAVPVWEAPSTALATANGELLATRVALHRVAGSSDRLLLDYQDQVAAGLGVGDADALMARVAASGRAVAWAYDDAWRRARSWVAGPKGRGAGGDRDLGPGVVLRDGEIDVSGNGDLADSSLLLRAAAQAARLDVPFRRGALERLTEAAPPGDPWTDVSRDAFVGLLGSGPPLVAVVEALEHFDLMTRILPEWEPVRSRPQRNAFHRFTVDRHLIETVVQASSSTRSVARPDLLLVGSLLHDLGKGYPGDHTIAGIELIEVIGPRLGYEPTDVAVLETLVREHLLLPSIATSRDLTDPATIDLVATAVGDRETLHLLAALTRADSLATGESVWSGWKEELMGELVARVDAALAGESVTVEPAASRSADHAALVERAAGGLLVEPSDTSVTVVVHDRPGLLAAIVGVLSLHGLSVRHSEAATGSDDVAVDVFTVEREFDREPDWDRFHDELAGTLAGTFPLERRLAERAQRYRSPVAAARPPEPRVIVHPGASVQATVVEVRAADDLGLLYRIASTFTHLDLDIAQARAITLGQEAVDTFYVRDPITRGPVDDRAEVIVAALRAELAPTPDRR